MKIKVKNETMQRPNAVLKTRTELHADQESENAKEAKVWKRHAPIDQKTVPKTAQKTSLKNVIVKIVLEIEIGIEKEIGMLGTINDPQIVIVPQNAVAKDHHKQSMTTTARARNEKYQVKEAKSTII